MPSTSHNVALVTGADQPLGRAIARGLALEGWQVAVHYEHSAAEAQITVEAIRSQGGRAVAVQGWLQDEPSTENLLQQAADSLGPVSCLVNQAFRAEQDKVGDFSASRLALHMQSNLAAPILLARSLHSLTPAGQQSVVVNLLDQRLFNLSPDLISYTLSQAALHTATKLLAQALAPKVRVVGIATAIAGAEARLVNIEDVIAAVCFAASPSAVTGTTLLATGGQHLVPLQPRAADSPEQQPAANQF